MWKSYIPLRSLTVKETKVRLTCNWCKSLPCHLGLTLRCMPLISETFSYFQEAIVTSEEVGKDYEHVEAQQKKFDDFEKVRNDD